MPQKTFRRPLSTQNSPQTKNATRHESLFNALLTSFTPQPIQSRILPKFEVCMYSFFLGLLPNLELTWEAWFFTVTFMIITLSFVSSRILLTDHHPKKIAMITFGYFAVSLLLFGIIGLTTTLILHLVVYSFISDFSREKK